MVTSVLKVKYVYYVSRFAVRSWKFQWLNWNSIYSRNVSQKFPRSRVRFVHKLIRLANSSKAGRGN